jgi:type I restriction enzyme S subunit
MKNYKTEKLGEVCDFIGGSQPPKSTFVYDLSEVDETEYVRLIQIRDYKTDKHIVYIPKSSTKKFCTKDDVMIGRYGPPVFQILQGLEGAYNVALMKAVPKTKELDKDYLFRFLQSPDVQSYIVGLSERAAGQTGVNKQALHDYPINIPSLLEQKRIVAILDQAFADIDKARALTEQNLKNARKLFESYLQQVFSQCGEGWVEAELFDHIKFIDYRGRTPKKIESGLRLITAKNVRMGYLKSDPEEFVAPESYDDWMTRGIPQKGDVLFTTEAPLANVAQLDTDEKVVFAQRIITMQPDRSILDCDFLKYLLMSQPIQKKIHEKGTGATATGIKASLLKKIPIEYPAELSEQRKHVEVLDDLAKKVKELEVIYSDKLAALDELKKSLLQKAFSGELTKDKQEAA